MTRVKDKLSGWVGTQSWRVVFGVLASGVCTLWGSGCHVPSAAPVGGGGASGAAGGGADDASAPHAGNVGAAAAGSPGGSTGSAANRGAIPGCTATALPGGTTLSGIWIGPAGEVWVVGQDGFVGRSAPDASGGAWSFCHPGTTANLNAIWGAASDDVWAVGDGGTILRWNGATWGTESGSGGAPVSTDLYDVWGETASAGDTGAVWVVGDGGVVRRFDGTAWQIGDAEPRYFLRGVWGSPSGVVRVVGRSELPIVEGIAGNEAVVLRLGDGLIWTREAVYQTDRGAAEFLRISGASDSDVWAVGDKYPSGAADSFALAVRFDGSSWSLQAGLDAPAAAPEEVIAARRFSDVAVRTPDAPAGAWFTSDSTATGVRFDGTIWTEADPVTTGLVAIDVRGAAMWATGLDGKVVRWTPAGWIVSNPPSPAAP